MKLGVRERDEDNELSVWMRMMKREDWKGLVGRRGEERREREGEREGGGKGRGLLAGICWLVARETSIVAAGGP